MNKAALLVTVILFAIMTEAFSQSDFRDGFIITNEKDTIYGKISYHTALNSSKSFLFKRGSSEEEFTPDKLIGYGFINDKYFSSRIIKDTFVEVLVAGKLSLYKSGFDLYVQQRGDTLMWLESKQIRDSAEVKNLGITEYKVGYREDVRWKGILSVLTSDCVDSYNALPKLTLDEKDLTKFVISYNLCTGSAYTDFKARKKWTKFDCGIYGGLAFSSLMISNKTDAFHYLDGSYNSIDPLYGLQVAISSPRINERIALQAELYYLRSGFHSLAIENRSSVTEYNDTYIDFTSVSLPLSVRYTFPGKGYSIFFNAGADVAVYFDSGTKLISEVQSGDVVDSYESEPFKLGNNPLGIWGGAGIRKSLHNLQIGAVLKYYRSGKLNTTEGFKSNINRISMSIIITGK